MVKTGRTQLSWGDLWHFVLGMLWHYCTFPCTCSAQPPHLPNRHICLISTSAWRPRQLECARAPLTRDLRQVSGWAASPLWWSFRCLTSPLAKSTGTKEGDLLSGRSEVWKTKSSYPSLDHQWTCWVTTVWLQHPTPLTWLASSQTSLMAHSAFQEISPHFFLLKPFSTSIFFHIFNSNWKKASLCLKTCVSKPWKLFHQK